MKTLSADTQALIDSPHVSVARLAQIAFADGLVLYLCDRVFGGAGSECVFDGHVYDPLVLSWETADPGKMDEQTGELDPSAASMIIDNNTPVGGASRFVSLFAAHDIHFAAVEIFEIFEDVSGAVGGSGDEVMLFAGTVEDVLNMDTPRLTLTLSGYELNIAGKYACQAVDAATYPNSDPDDRGKMLPEIYGAAKRVPLMGIDVGIMTTLAEAAAVGDTELVLSAAAGIGGSGSVRIDSETIAYTGVSGNTLTGVSVTAAHKKGAMCGEVKAEYVFAAAHAVKAIDDVYIKGVRQLASEYTAYTGQTGDEHATYPGRAVVVFTDMSVIMAGDLSLTDNTGFDLTRRVAGLPIGHVTAIDRYGRVAGYDDSATITFPDAPAGDLSEIYVEYEYEFRSYPLPAAIAPDPAETWNIPEGGFSFYLDGVRVGVFTAAGLTQTADSPLRVDKSAWPVSAVKSKTLRHTSFGTYALIVRRATVYCTSTVSEYDQQGKYITREAERIPVGAVSDEITCDTAAAITFAAAPSGNLSDIMLMISWQWHRTGEAIYSDKPLTYYIGGQPVLVVGEDLSDASDQVSLMAGTIYLPQAAWQTSVAKTPSRLDQFGRGEEFLITAARQSCWTDDFSADYELSGNSMADAKLGGRVTADIDGYQDDALGTYTGTPGALIERADHIGKHIILDRCGQDAGRIDAASYAAAGALFAAGSYVLAFAILQRPDVRKLLNRIFHQSRAMEWWSAGVHKILYIPEAAPGAVKTITADRIDLSQVWLRYTDRAGIINHRVSRYNHFWDVATYSEIEAARNSVTGQDAASIAKYGTIADDGSTPYIPGAVQAQAVVDWEIRDIAFPRLMIELAGGYWLADLEHGDVVNFDFEPGDELDQALLGLVAAVADKFRIIHPTDRPDGAKQIQMVKI